MRSRWRELAFWGGLASLFLLTTLGTLLAWAVLPGWVPGWSSTVVLSGSMAPRIEAGDVVVWSDTPAHEIGEGSVVVFVDDTGARTLHRVVEHTPGVGLRTKGDANPTPDSAPVPPERVEGAGRVLVPLVGVPRLWIRDGRWAHVGALVAVTIGALVGSRLCWSPEFDPWAAPATQPSGGRPPAPPSAPLVLPPVPARRPDPPALLPSAARDLLLVTTGGDRRA